MLQELRNHMVLFNKQNKAKTVQNTFLLSPSTHAMERLSLVLDQWNHKLMYNPQLGSFHTPRELVPNMALNTAVTNKTKQGS